MSNVGCGVWISPPLVRIGESYVPRWPFLSIYVLIASFMRVSPVRILIGPLAPGTNPSLITPLIRRSWLHTVSSYVVPLPAIETLPWLSISVALLSVIRPLSWMDRCHQWCDISPICRIPRFSDVIWFLFLVRCQFLFDLLQPFL